MPLDLIAVAFRQRTKWQKSHGLQPNNWAKAPILVRTASVRGRPESCPMNKPNRRLVTELDQALNAYGRTIYVQEWDDYTDKPQIWYEYNKQKILVKSIRGPNGISVTYIGKVHYIKC